MEEKEMTPLELLECPNCILGLNCKTCKKKKYFKQALKENAQLKVKISSKNTLLEEWKKLIEDLKKENEELKERMQVYEKYVSIRGMNNDELWCNSKITEEEKKLLYTQEYVDKKDNHYEEMLKKNTEVINGK